MRLLIPSFVLLFTASSQAANIDLVGLRSYSKKQLLETISGRLEYIKKRDATPQRADDAAFLVQSYLQSHGLPDALVDWSLPPNGDILLTVNEGPPKFLGAITVTGLDDPKKVTEQFQAAFPETAKKRAFVSDSIPSGTSRIIDLLNSQGYWSATVVASPLSRDVNGQIPMRIEIQKGPQYLLALPKLESPTRPGSSLIEKLQAIQGTPASSETIIKTRKSIHEHYRKRGYADLELEMAKELTGTRLQLFFKVTPGKRFKVRSFNIEGLVKTLPEKVHARFKSIAGKTFDENKINEAIKKLITTGAFAESRLSKSEAPNQELDLTLHLKEAEARGVSFSAGFGSYEGAILGARYYDRNLWGRLWNLNAGVEVTSLGALGEISLTDPYFLDRDLQFNRRLFTLTRDHDAYSKWESGIGLELSWDYGEHYSATLGFENSFTTISSSIPVSIIGQKDYGVSRISFRQEYDRRDDPTLPTDGWLADLESSLGVSLGDNGVPFFETEGGLSYYKTLGENSRYALGIRGGFIKPSGDSSNLPIDLRKFLGGSNTVRSFTERDLGPKFGNDPIGGTSWWVANAEYTRQITGPVQGVLFLDAGALSPDPAGLFDADIEVAAGLGIRLDLPVGPVRLEYGYSLTRDNDEPAGAFHFAIGATF
ncbi:BamA/TamA family outer membrane protein [Akkermansiaceae bacterium]|nr:BamA/TamA family outer membrane protein [Akkermansiaceae bacterium]